MSARDREPRSALARLLCLAALAVPCASACDPASEQAEPATASRAATTIVNVNAPGATVIINGDGSQVVLAGSVPQGSASAPRSPEGQVIVSQVAVTPLSPSPEPDLPPLEGRASLPDDAAASLAACEAFLEHARRCVYWVTSDPMARARFERTANETQAQYRRVIAQVTPRAAAELGRSCQSALEAYRHAPCGDPPSPK